jgi:MoxR-like ATPase
VQLDPMISGEEIIRCQELVRRVPVPEHVTDFILDLVRRCRPANPNAPSFIRELVGWGAGPRACQMLTLGGKVRALLRGRLHVTVDDVEALAQAVLRHRLIPTFNAEAEGVTVDDIVTRVLNEIPRRKAKAL